LLTAALHPERLLLWGLVCQAAFDCGVHGWHFMGLARRNAEYVAWGDSLRRCILIRGRGV